MLTAEWTSESDLGGPVSNAITHLTLIHGGLPVVSLLGLVCISSQLGAHRLNFLSWAPKIPVVYVRVKFITLAQVGVMQNSKSLNSRTWAMSMFINILVVLAEGSYTIPAILD